MFTILDYVQKDLDVLSVKITDESGKDLSGSWEITKTKQAVEAPTTVVANNHNASNASFYDKTYNLLITVRLRDDVEISSGYTITNTANVTGTGTPTYSNSVKTKVNVKGPSISKYINTIVTASKNYNGSATKNEETPNTILLLVEDEAVQSNTPKLYRSGVNSPVKSIDKSEISEKTETVTYTISNEVESKSQEYFYNTFVISDKLADVLEYKSAKIVNEKGADLYKDEYQGRLREIIEMKIAGKEVVTSSPEVKVNAIDIMEALKQSLAQAGVKSE